MKIIEGFKAVDDIAKEYSVNYSEKLYLQNFWLKEDETIEDVWFNGGPNEPLNVPVHVIRKVLKGGRETFDNMVCRGEECVACRVAEIDKSVGDMKYISVVSVADPRLVHEIDVEGKKYKKTISCIGVGCKLCAEGVGIKPRGQAKWEMSIRWAQQLATKDKDLRSVCLCGGRIKEGVCKRCGSADINNRQSIYAVPFRITRTGAYKNTAYVISPMPMDDMPDWVKALPKIDLRKAYPIPSAAYQAKVLGVRNPFSKLGSTGKSSIDISPSTDADKSPSTDDDKSPSTDDEDDLPF